jgi:hypothetical protein
MDEIMADRKKVLLIGQIIQKSKGNRESFLVPSCPETREILCPFREFYARAIVI